MEIFISIVAACVGIFGGIFGFVNYLLQSIVMKPINLEFDRIQGWQKRMFELLDRLQEEIKGWQQVVMPEIAVLRAKVERIDKEVQDIRRDLT